MCPKNGQKQCHKYVFVSNTLNSQKQLVQAKTKIKKNHAYMENIQWKLIEL